jgi:hypothetical protein
MTSRRSLTVRVGYKHIGPGYVSLGVASLPADQRGADLGVNVRFRRWSANLKSARFTDNLIGQKLATTTRYHFGGSFSFKTSRRLTSSVRATYNSVGNDASQATRRIAYVNWVVGTNQTLAFGPRSRLRTVSLSYHYQKAGDPNPLRASTSFRAHNTTVKGTIRPAKSLTVTPAAGLVISQAGTAGWDARRTLSLAARLRGPDGKWSTSGTVSSSVVRGRSTLQGTISARYRVTPADEATLSLRTNRVRGLPGEVSQFEEYSVRLKWSRRFQ